MGRFSLFRNFSAIAVKNGFITIDQLKVALSIQIDENVSGEDHRLLGTILFEKDWMSTDQIEVVLNLLLKQMGSENESEETNP